MAEVEGVRRVTDLLNLELRHLDASKLTKLSSIMDKAKAWEQLLEELTRPLSSAEGIKRKESTLKLSLDAIKLIEQQFHCGKSPSLALLNHWAITGRRRPTVRCLIYYLRICNMKWAEDYVWQSVLGIEPPEIDRAVQPAVMQSIKSFQDNLDIDNQYKFDTLEELINGLETKCTRYSFKSIYETTNGFCHKPYEPSKNTGSKIGEGRFSSVYRASTQTESSYPNGGQMIVAAKLLKSECNKKYLANEINLIGRIHHPNILELIGISLGQSQDVGPNYICLIYPYMLNGSLLDCLSNGLLSNNMEFLTWQKRIEIAVKVARGISYLHSFHEGPIIHRDIKTANILINTDLEPKVGDFTLVRQMDVTRANETQFSQNIIGTSVYMPQEAFRGDISTKFDTFSFGIVLLELLSGLRPFNEDLDEDLFTYINDRLSDIDDETSIMVTTDGTTSAEGPRDKFLSEILDKKAGNWNFESSKVMFKIALKATESRKKNRPEISAILPNLEAILPQSSDA